MQKKHQCICCNYETDKLSNYKKHLQTRKHKSNMTSNYSSRKDECRLKKDDCRPRKDEKYSKDGFKCEFCLKWMKDKSNKARHYKLCKEKKQKEEHEAKMSKEKELKMINNKLEKEKLELLEKVKMLEQQKEHIKDEYMTFLKKVGEKSLEKMGTQNIQNISCNIYYIMNNCKNAYDYEELMDPELTESEIESLTNSTAVNGCFNLLNNRCIEGIEFHKRPIHLLDGARKKYYVKTKGEWKVDKKGEEILNVITQKVKNIYLSKDPNDTTEIIMAKNNKFKELFDDRFKILEYADDHILLKNNVKLLIGK